jgi:uracil-DNA glycosylase
MQTRTLGDPVVQLARMARLQEPHITPLTALADRLSTVPDRWAPYFDPKSGGTAAQVLLLLESPGPQVSKTGFVSADNPDGTAENMSCLLKLAGLSRKKILLWNIFPWQLSANSVVTPTDQNLRDAVPATLELLALLPKLKVIILVGQKAKVGWEHATVPVNPAIKIMTCPHPSPQHFNTKPEAAALALSVLGQARQRCT